MDNKFLKAVGLSAARAFISVFVLGMLNVYSLLLPGEAVDVNAGKTALIALITAAGAAALKAVQAAFTNWDPADAEINPPADEKPAA
jgi:hypothetical protein